MSPLSLLVALALCAAPPPTRLLTDAELDSVQGSLAGARPLAKQSLELRALGGDPLPWFVAAEKDGRFHGALLVGGALAATLASDEAGFQSLDALEATDYDGDGKVDLVAIARYPAASRVLLLRQSGPGLFEEQAALAARLTRDLAPRPTVKKVRERVGYLLGRFGPPRSSPPGLAPSCQEIVLPFAMTADVRLAASRDKDGGISLEELRSGDRPEWMTSRLRSTLAGDVQFGCVMDRQYLLMHGRIRDCQDPLVKLNRELKTLKRPIEFVDLARLFATDQVDFDGAVITLHRKMVGGKEPLTEIPIGAFRCGENETPSLVGVVIGQAVAYVFVERAADQTASPERDRAQDAEVFSPEGTWLQDLIPESPEPRRVRLLTVPLAP